MIYINDKLRISKVDERCVQLEVLTPVQSRKTGETTEQWKWNGYYGDVKSALYGSFKKQLIEATEDELAIKEVISRIEQAENNILNAVKTLGNSTTN